MRGLNTFLQRRCRAGPVWCGLTWPCQWHYWRWSLWWSCLQPTSPCKSSSVLTSTESHLLLKMPPTTLTWWSGQWLCHPISDERQMWSQWVRHVCSLQDCIQLCNVNVGLYSTNIYLSSPYISSHLQHWRGNFLGSFRDLVDKIGILMQKKESLHLIMVSHPSFF